MQARSFYMRCLSMQTARGIQLETIFSFNNPRLSCFCLVKVKWDADSMGWRWRDTRETCREFICHYKHISQFCKFLKLFGIGIKRKSLFVNHWCFPGRDDIFSFCLLWILPLPAFFKASIAGRADIAFISVVLPPLCNPTHVTGKQM